jgi:hypothetical protein
MIFSLEVVSDISMGVYYNGVIKSAKKLDKRDFIMLSRAALGSIVRRKYKEEQITGDTTSFVADFIVESEFNTKKNPRGIIEVDFDYVGDAIMKLPNGDGILRITPLYSEESLDYTDSYTKGIAGMESYYCTPQFLEDTGEKIFIATSKSIKIYGDEAEKVEMAYISIKDDAVVPEDIGWEVINYVLGITLRVTGFPVDKTNDSDPNVQYIKSKIASAQE